MATKESSDKDEITLKDLLEKVKEWYGFLLSQWKFIVVAGVLGGVLGLAYSFTKKPIYTATLSFALEDEKSASGLGGALGLASSFGFDLGGSGGGIFSGSNLNELFKSRRMVEKTLLTPVLFEGKKISLIEMYIKNNKWRAKWQNIPKLKNFIFLPNANRRSFNREQDSILGEVYENISKKGLTVTQKDEEIAITIIEVISKNELFSKYFAEALANEVSQFYIITKSKKARLNMAILKQQTDSIRSELNSAITGVAVANDNTFGLNPAVNIRRVPSAKRQVDVQANTAILTELVKQTELAKVTLRKETPLIQVIDSPILPLKKDKLGKGKAAICGMLLLIFISVLYLIVKKIFAKENNLT